MKKSPGKYNNYKKSLCLINNEWCAGPLDIAHVKSQKAHPELKNEEWNCPTICRLHHSEQHTIGVLGFSKKYSAYKNWLIKNGWEQCELTRKWVHG